MKFEKLTELIDERITGEWGQEPVSSGVKVIRTTNFTNEGKLDLSNVVERDITAKKIEKKALQKGDIIIEKSGGGPTQPVGRVVYFDIDSDEKYLCNNFTTILRPKLNLVDSKYLLYQLLYLHKSGRTKRYQNKTTGIHNLNLEKYLQEKIALPLLPDQLHIANILSKAENLIAQRKESISLLDEFLKSTFLEMFGDPVRNEKGYSKTKLNILTKIGTGGTPSRKREIDFYNGDIPWVKTTEVNGSYILNTEEKITKAAIKESNCKLYPSGTILLAMYGQGKTRGNVGVLKIEATTNQACAAIIPSENFDTIFLFEQLKQLYKHIRSLAKGSNQENLNLSIVGNIEVQIPPIELQIQFAQIVEKTESLKTQYQQSLLELENLYGSLSQKAFRGELVKN